MATTSTIGVETIFTDTMNLVNQSIGNFVQAVYQNLVSSNMTEITILFTVFVVMAGYPFLVRSASADVHVLIRRLILMTIVYGLIVNWSLYNKFFFNIFTNEPDQLAIIIAKTINPGQAGADGGLAAAQALNTIFNQGMNIATVLMKQVTLSKIGLAFYAFLVAAVDVFSCAMGLCLLVYAKLALAVILGVGPIFIMFLLWDNTRGLFDSWVRNALNFALIPVITTSVLAMMVVIETAALNAADPSITASQEVRILPFICVGIVAFMVLRQVLPICVSLSGLLSLTGMSQLFTSTSQTLNGARANTQKTVDGADHDHSSEHSGHHRRALSALISHRRRQHNLMPDRDHSHRDHDHDHRGGSRSGGGHVPHRRDDNHTGTRPSRSLPPINRRPDIDIPDRSGGGRNGGGGDGSRIPRQPDEVPTIPDGDGSRIPPTIPDDSRDPRDPRDRG